MNYTIEKDINEKLFTETQNSTFKSYITDYTKNKKTFYNIIKNNIIEKHKDKNNYNNLSKMLALDLLDYTFKHLNEHQQKIFIFKSDYINIDNFDNELKELQEKKGASI